MIIRRNLFGPNLRWRDPFEELQDMRNRMERLFGSWADTKQGSGVYPLVNVTEDKDAYWVCSELPGMDADDLDISITGSRLAITGERKINPEDESAKFHRRERQPGKFSRMIELSDQVDPEKVEASMKNGVLQIKLPKSELAKPRQIQIH